VIKKFINEYDSNQLVDKYSFLDINNDNSSISIEALLISVNNKLNDYYQNEETYSVTQTQFKK
jgi:hypothetical protein